MVIAQLSPFHFGHHPYAEDISDITTEFFQNQAAGGRQASHLQRFQVVPGALGVKASPAITVWGPRI
jgi:hypothetical protein